MDEAELFKPGDRVAEFHIKEVLAEGGFAVLYVADEKASHSGLVLREVALKVVKSRHAGNPEVVRRAEGELVTLCRVDHPNLCRVFRGGVLPSGAVYIAMERLHGLSLGQYVHRQGPLEVSEAFAIGAAVADALGALHEFGVVHRDIKPDNVFITTQGQVKLLDINSARFYSLGFKSTVPGRSPGTPAFMAPEQFDPDSKPDHRSDLYALGLTLYEALTGRHAFAVTNAGNMPVTLLDIIIAQVSWQFPSLADLGVCSPSEWEILARSLAKRADERYPRAADFARALRGARKHWLEEHPDAHAGRVVSQPGKRLQYVPAHEPVRGFQPEADPDRRVVLPSAASPRPAVAVPTAPTPQVESQVERDLATIRELGQRDDRDARDALLSVVQRRRHVALTVAALEELARIGDITCIPVLVQILESETDSIVRAHIELALAALDPEERALQQPEPRRAAKPRPAAGRPAEASTSRDAAAAAPVAVVPPVAAAPQLPFATTEPRAMQNTTARGTLRIVTGGGQPMALPASPPAGSPGVGAHGTLPVVPLDGQAYAAAVRASEVSDGRAGQPGTPPPVTVKSGGPAVEAGSDRAATRLAGIPLLRLVGLGALIGIPLALIVTFAALRFRQTAAPPPAPGEATRPSQQIPAEPQSALPPTPPPAEPDSPIPPTTAAVSAAPTVTTPKAVVSAARPKVPIPGPSAAASGVVGPGGSKALF